jgi:hypothetical protein
MDAPIIEYVVARQQGEGWRVLRDGSPVGRRCVLVNALELATLLAEREATRGGGATRVLMARQDTHRLPGYHPWRSVT